MNKSNLNGGGRGRWESGRTVIGDIINHGKKDLWHPSKSVHYHATLSAGENTLEARCAACSCASSPRAEARSTRTRSETRTSNS